MNRLFEQINIRSVEIKNRIMLSPMCQYSSSDGKINNWHLIHYGSRAVGGAGIVMVEATAVAPDGRITPADLGIYYDDISGYKNLTDFISSTGSIPAIQIAHAGRKGAVRPPWSGDKPIAIEDGGWRTVAPSAIPFDNNWPLPKELDHADIKSIIELFGKGAVRAVKAGFKIVEIHAAHGYLIHQFLSPVSNKRDDNYGGTYNNRIRFLLEIVDKIRDSIPSDIPLFVRISATDWLNDGWSINESVKLAEILKKHGIDLIDVSSGGIKPHVKIPAVRGYQVPFSEAIRKTGVLTSAVGMIDDSEYAEEIIEKGYADVVAIGREMLRNPYWPLNAAYTLKETVKWPLQYIRSSVKSSPKGVG